MPATDIDALLPGALDTITATLTDDTNPSAQWQVAASMLNVLRRNPAAPFTDVYDLAIGVLETRIASADPDEARWAAIWVCEFEARNPAL